MIRALALLLALALPAQAWPVVKWHQPAISFWVLDKPGVGHEEWRGEAFYFVEWRWVNNDPHDFSKCFWVVQVSAAEWANSNVRELEDGDEFDPWEFQP